jgi:hypothetical protein
MFDELQRLRETPELIRLLKHYAELGAVDRTIWQDRLMELEGVQAQAQELSRLHGELIAHDWIELNVGFTTGKTGGAAAKGYRVTLGGLRALKRAQSNPEDDEETAGIEAKTPWRPRRGRHDEPVILPFPNNVQST